MMIFETRQEAEFWKKCVTRAYRDDIANVKDVKIERDVKLLK